MTTPRRGRVTQHRVAQTVASELRTRILNSTDDYRLPTQDQLVQEFGVSYPSIREAIRILETEGLVTVRRGNVEKSMDLIDDGVAFTQTAREFHDLVVSFTPNATVRYVVSSLVALWSAQEEAWAEALTGRGEYPSPEQARAAVRTHQKIVDDIASGQASAWRRYRPERGAPTRRFPVIGGRT